MWKSDQKRASAAWRRTSDCGFEQIDLTPSDYYLFGKLKKLQFGHILKANLRVLELLLKRCNKSIDVNGDYVEK